MNQDGTGQPVEEGTLLWEPSEELRSNSSVAKFMEWLGQTKDLQFETYDELLQWSVDDLEGFLGRHLGLLPDHFAQPALACPD